MAQLQQPGTQALLNGRDVMDAQETWHNEFGGGKEDFAVVARIAAACPGFSPDDADEWVADEARSCYNCRARRWTPASFVCLRGFS